jgi:ABC-2 type transport system permease protein
MNNAFINLVAIQLRELIREPEVLFWAVLFPVSLSAVLGFAFSQQGTKENKVGYIQNQFSEAHTAITILKNNPSDSLSNTDFTFVPLDSAQAFLQLKRGEIGLIINPESQNSFTYHFDPANENAYLQYLQLEKKLQTGNATQIKPIVTRGSRYIDFLIPGMIALGLMNSCIWGIGWSLIELRIKKLLRRMVATPMNRSQFLLAQFATRLILTLFENILLLLFAYFLFDVRVQGSLFTVLLLFIAGNMAFGGIAILVAARPEKTQVGSGIINFITLTLTIVSGIFFSYTNFPGWAASIIQYMPLTLLADAFRSVFNEAASLAEVGSKILILLSYGVVCFIIGLRVFKWY